MPKNAKQMSRPAHWGKTGKGSLTREEVTLVDLLVPKASPEASGLDAEKSPDPEFRLWTAAVTSVLSTQIPRNMVPEKAKFYSGNLPAVPPGISENDSCPNGLVDKGLEKYWKQRYSLFSLFDEGVKLDEDAWFEVCPESLAQHMAWTIETANKLEDPNGDYRPCVEFCSGVGGLSVSLARTLGDLVVNDLCANRIGMLKHNLTVYGQEVVESHVGDVFEVCAKLEAAQEGTGKPFTFNAAVCSPPWGGIDYNGDAEYSFTSAPFDLFRALQCFGRIARNVFLHVPRKTNVSEVILMGQRAGFTYIEMEKIYYEMHECTKCGFVGFYRDPTFASYRMEVGKKPLAAHTFVGPKPQVHRQNNLQSLLLPVGLARLGEEPTDELRLAFRTILQNIPLSMILSYIAEAHRLFELGELTIHEKTTKERKRSLGGTFFLLVKTDNPELTRTIDRKRKKMREQSRLRREEGEMSN